MLSNYFVLPLVKLLGIGLGFSLYHFVNLMVGYCIGRFGLFGVTPLTGQLVYCDGGCLLILMSFFIMVFVEAGHGDDEDSEDSEESDESRASSTDNLVGEGMTAAECDMNFMSVGGFSVFGAPSNRQLAARKGDQRDPNRRKSSLDTLGPGARKVVGVLLAVVAGGLCGVQGVPATLWEKEHPDVHAFAVALPQCFGIWACSSVLLMLYSSIAVVRGVKLQKSVIGPAYASGCIWGVGFACMMKGIKYLGYSVGYTLDAVGPILVSSLLSVFVFREITGQRQLMIYFGAFFLQLVGVILIASFGKPD